MRLKMISGTDAEWLLDEGVAATDLLSRAADVISAQRGVTTAQALAMLDERAACGKRNKLVLAAELVYANSTAAARTSQRSPHEPHP